jgi:RNA polymerase sigma-70 factor, ECF subfamily
MRDVERGERLVAVIPHIGKTAPAPKTLTEIRRRGEPAWALLRLDYVLMGEAARRARAAELFDEYYAPLAGWAAAALGNESAGHDVASEAFTRMYARLLSVRTPRAFLYTVAANLVRDHWRRETRERGVTTALTAQAYYRPGPDRSTRDIVDRLPERLRLPVLLHYYADLPVAEIAKVLGKPPGTVKRTLSDARAALAPLLLESSDEC